MASFQPISMGQVATNPTAQGWQGGKPVRRRKRKQPQTDQQLPRHHDASSAPVVERQRPLLYTAPQPQLLAGFQDGPIQLPHSQETNTSHDGQQSFGFPGSIGQPLEQATGGIFDNIYQNSERPRQIPNSKTDANDPHIARVLDYLSALNEKITNLEMTMRHRLTDFENNVTAKIEDAQQRIPETTGQEVMPVIMSSINDVLRKQVQEDEE